MGGIFKAYDVRGIYPGEISEAIARRIGNAFATFLSAGTIVVGRDMRASSAPLSEALVAGVRAAGTDVIDLGLCTTPMLYFASGRLEASGGVMVTASHNPSQYNGFKFCRERAVPVGSASGLGEVEARVFSGAPEVRAEKEGALRRHDIVADYAAMIRAAAGRILPAKVAIDCGNGAVGPFVERCLGQFPLEIVPLFFEPDGSFPNHEPNPIKVENLRELARAVVSEKCALGIAFDGDGDRAAFVDERGRPISGDMVTALIARRVLAREKGPVIYDLRSSRAVREEIEKGGGTPIEERVGHAFIKATMRARGALFAGELSGHFYFRENFNAESAMLAAIRMLEILSEDGRPLSAIVAEVDRYVRTGEINFPIEDKDAALARLAKRFEDARIHRLDGVTIAYDDWWCNVRKSNTEPLLRLNLEAADPKLLEKAKSLVIEALGVRPET
jgi:phosphomannomutase